MRDLPTVAELLELAQKTMEGSPSRYELLMVASAIGVARRELAAGDTALDAERAALAVIYGDAPLAELNRRFAADIRAGRFDDDPHAHEILRAATEAKLRECNPRYPR